ncbi:MAG: hypothetical protein HUK21_02290 [Fibrobacteraceae bacterium]|nr:hypothetical protein [Fibrobacteraceae bacterium]
MKKWLAFFFVLSLFVFSRGLAFGETSIMGNLAPYGLPDYSSTPARFLDTLNESLLGNVSLGAFYWGVNEVSENMFGAHGEWFGTIRENHLYRGGVYYHFLMMDSLYREQALVYNLAWNSLWAEWLNVSVGASYGAWLNWIPEESFWVRHSYGVGSTLGLSSLFFAGQIFGFVDEGVEFRVGAHWYVKRRFHAFGEYDGSGFEIGNGVVWKFLEVHSRVRFPEFGVALMVALRWNSLDFGGLYGFNSSHWAWKGLHLGI